MKKLLSFFMAIVLILAMTFPIFSVNAATETTQTSKDGISIGDCITMGSYNGKPIVWRCVDIDENGPLMLSEEILCNKAFDALGESSYHTDGWGYIRKQYGSNCWQDSNIRQWLNSNESTVSWTHCPPTSNNVTKNPYDTESGFLSNFTIYERSKIKNVKRLVNVNIWEYKRYGYCDGGTSDRAFKYIQKYDFNPKSYYYKYITDSVFLLSAQEYNNIYKKNKNLLKSDYKYWSCINNGNNYACYEQIYVINENGNIECVTVSNGNYGIRPAFYLQDSYYIYDENASPLSESDALDFIGFLINSKDIYTPQNIATVKQSELFKLLTGKYYGSDIVEKSIVYSDFIQLSTGKYAAKYNESCEYFRQSIIDYLNNYVPESGIGITSEIIGEYKCKAQKKLNEALLDCVKSIFGLSEAVNGMYVDIAFESFGNLSSTISAAKEYSDYVCAAVDGVLLAYSQEMAGHYGYFNDYISFRPTGSPNDDAFIVYYDYLRLAYQDQYKWAGFLDLLTFFTHKESFLENFDTLDRWAECVYLMSTIKVNPEICNHSYITIEIADATCISAGEKVEICQICNHSNIEKISQSNHFYVVSNKVSAICNQNGYIEYTCYGCMDTYTKTINTTGHSISVIENDDCYLYQCNNCEYSYQKSKEHTHSYTQDIVEADCENYGYTINECECGDVYLSNYTEPSGHNYSDGLITESTCLSNGKIDHICSYCGDIYFYELPLNEHNYTKNYIEATCLAEGKFIYTCTSCGIEFEEIVSDKIGHQYSDYSSCNENCINHTIGMCINCDAKKEIITPNHNYSDIEIPATYTKPKTKTKICKDCEYKTEATVGVALADFNSDGVVNQTDYTEFENSISLLDASLFDFDKNDVVDDFDSGIIKNLTSDTDFTEIIDINGDGESDIRDLVRAKKILAESNPEESENGNADRNLDGETDSNDMVFVRKFILMVDLKLYA